MNRESCLDVKDSNIEWNTIIAGAVAIMQAAKKLCDMGPDNALKFLSNIAADQQIHSELDHNRITFLSSRLKDKLSELSVRQGRSDDDLGAYDYWEVDDNERVPKFLKLKEILDVHCTQNNTNKVIILCRERGTVQFVYNLIQKYMPWTCPHKLIGHVKDLTTTETLLPWITHPEGGMPEAEQRRIVKEFKEKDERRILVATDVAQEGLDAKVNVVICYDPLMSVRSYIQSLGRIRLDHGFYYVIARVLPEEHNNDIDLLKGQRMSMEQAIADKCPGYNRSRSPLLLVRSHNVGTAGFVYTECLFAYHLMKRFPESIRCLLKPVLRHECIDPCNFLLKAFDLVADVLYQQLLVPVKSSMKNTPDLSNLSPFKSFINECYCHYIEPIINALKQSPPVSKDDLIQSAHLLMKTGSADSEDPMLGVVASGGLSPSELDDVIIGFKMLCPDVHDAILDAIIRSPGIDPVYVNCISGAMIGQHAGNRSRLSANQHQIDEFVRCLYRYCIKEFRSMLTDMSRVLLSMP